MKKKYCGNNLKSLSIFLLVIGLTISCNNSPGNHATNAVISKTKDTAHQKPPASFSDTITIDVPSAVFYNPDSLQLNKIKGITDTGVFESIVHDCFFQMRNSRIVLKKYFPGIKIIEVKNARYLLFIKAGGEKEYIDLNTKNDPCGLFIFNRKKAPILVDMTNVETELGFYFSK